MTTSGAGTPRQVVQVREQLHESFDGVLDDSDIAHFRGESYEQRFLSRALAALAVRRLAKCSVTEAVGYVTDGIADQGLDAIAPLPESGQALLVQAKWSDDGKATFDVSAAKAMVDGLNRIENELYEQFNQRAAALAVGARSQLINGKTTLVIALMGTVEPSLPARQVLDNSLNEFNKHGARLRIQVLYAADFHEQVHADLRPEPIHLSVRLDDWYQHDGPLEAYQGTVSAERVAEWYEEHGTALFEQNLRAPLGATVTNAEIGQTITTEPTKFWHLNNGITMICDALSPEYDSARAPRSRPTTLTVTGASIVNGAQTVRAVARAVHDDGEAAAHATLSIKVINTQGDKRFGLEVSQAANRQNAIEPRDRIALEPVHQAIKANLRAELRKHYVIKRGEPVPAPETGCSLDEVALALACLYPDPEQAARVASSTENLWELGPNGSHTLLFGREPSPHKVWRSVLTLRAVRSGVYELGNEREGREAAVAEHGGFLVTHLLFQYLGATSIEDPDFDWESEVLEKIPALIPDVVRRLTHQMTIREQRPQIRVTFQSADACRDLSDVILRQLADGVAVPKAPTKPRKTRRQNTVPLLIDRRVIKEGTLLRFVGETEPERKALEDWLAEDERRRQATWVNHRTKSILWAYDQQQYSPTGLVSKMWFDAEWDEKPVANQGTTRWFLADGQSLWDLALRIHSEEVDDGEGQPE